MWGSGEAVAKWRAGVSATPNKCKEKQGNPSKKACISLDSFGGIVTFQWVTANPNKKICSPRLDP
jgi:hypothetical protein